MNSFAPFFFSVTILCKMLVLCCPSQCLFLSVFEGIAHHIKGEKYNWSLCSPESLVMQGPLLKYICHTLWNIYMASVFISHHPNTSQDIAAIQEDATVCYGEGKLKYKVPTWIGNITKEAYGELEIEHQPYSSASMSALSLKRINGAGIAEWLLKSISQN